MNTKIWYLLIGLVISNNVMSQSQEDEMTSKSSNTYIGFYTGCWIPIGKLARKIDPGPSFEIKCIIGRRTLEKPSVEIYLNFFAPTSRPFYYTTSDTTVLTRVTYGIAAGLRLVEEIPLRKGSFIDYMTLSTGIGFQGIVVDYKPDKDKDESLGGFCFQIGSTVSKRVWQTRFIGLTVFYNFVPSSLIQKHVGRDFGSSSINVGLEYRF